MPKISAKNLTVAYVEKGERFVALQDVSFAIAAGEFISILGASGCGKSTLLSVLGGLKTATAGEAAIDGEPIAGTGANRSFVFQHYSLFPWMTAKKNVVFALKQARRKLSRREQHALADEFLAQVGLEKFKDKFPAQLSGGMQQRVAIARALATDAEIMLMDEPFGAIDAKNRTLLQELLLRLWESGERKKTVVFVTHDVDEAMLLSDRILMFSSHPGRVSREIAVPFPRPRDRARLVAAAEYHELRNVLLSLYFNDPKNTIIGDGSGI
ncbi:MAG: ABC transporter ATP-binding protein [Planctomycetota bacterium]|jgi:NitT/TauT family transport system ATP-binding protein|nr:ABC transporter ATP-binding protein [Planctomycetota bacterium]